MPLTLGGFPCPNRTAFSLPGEADASTDCAGVCIILHGHEPDLGRQADTLPETDTHRRQLNGETWRTEDCWVRLSGTGWEGWYRPSHSNVSPCFRVPMFPQCFPIGRIETSLPARLKMDQDTILRILSRQALTQYMQVTVSHHRLGDRRCPAAAWPWIRRPPLSPPPWRRDYRDRGRDDDKRYHRRNNLSSSNAHVPGRTGVSHHRTVLSPHSNDPHAGSRVWTRRSGVWQPRCWCLQQKT
ncbi:hypothetical protein BCR44DRAFT_1438750, partial [Catenaria anguillulae PL171]